MRELEDKLVEQDELIQNMQQEQRGAEESFTQRLENELKKADVNFKQQLDDERRSMRHKNDLETGAYRQKIQEEQARHAKELEQCRAEHKV